MCKLRQMTSGVLAATVLTFGLLTTSPAPVYAQQQSGLVNVTVGDVIVAPAVNVQAALNLAAQICGVNVGVVAAQFGTGNAICQVRDQSTGALQNVQIVRIK